MSAQKLTSSGVQLVKERNRGSNQVKLCGYLKKKRNKVGGWRKMWFVLQDKLLLSYSSKEEYDNKLVSFKDVLNLVPGTIVRPLGGYRFTIETATNFMYTFHCDDRTAYREWITTLLDSLSATTNSKFISATCTSSTSSFSGSPAITSAAYSLLPMQLQRFRNTSVDNIPRALWSSVVAVQNSQCQRELSSSCDTMRQRVELADDGNYGCEYAYLERINNSKKTTAINGSDGGGSGSGGVEVGSVGESGVGVAARLPIARSTAKILERNGVNSSGVTVKQKQKHQQQQIFQKRHQQQQVNCCNRNNGTIANLIDGNKGNNNNNNFYDKRKSDNNANESFTTEECATRFRLHGESAIDGTEFSTAADNVQVVLKANCSSGSDCSASSSFCSSASASNQRHSIHQSVLRINSMFQQQQSASSAPSSQSSTAPSRSASSSSSSQGCDISHRRHDHVVNKKFLLSEIKSTQASCDPNEFLPKNNPKNNRKSNKNNSSGGILVDCCALSDNAQVVDDNISAIYSCCTNDSTPMVVLKDQIQRMNIKGSRKETVSNASADTVDRREQTRIVVTKNLENETITETAANMSKAVGRISKANSMDKERIPITKGMREEDDNGPYSHSALQSGDDMNKITTKTCSNRSSEPIYAVVDLAHKYAQRQQRCSENNLKTLDAQNCCRSYESIIQATMEPSSIGTSSRGVRSIDKSSSNLPNDDDIDGIYEDGDEFVANCRNAEVLNKNHEENIYEPVGFQIFASAKIDSASTHPPSNAFWRYITRFKVKPLLQFTCKQRQNPANYDNVQISATPSPTPSPAPAPKTKYNNSSKKPTKRTWKLQPSTVALTPQISARTQFTSIKHKFGAHRKSMQVRMRKMCTRRCSNESKPKTYSNNNCNKPTCNGDGNLLAATMPMPMPSNDGIVNCGGSHVDGVVKKSKYRWKSVKIRPKHLNSNNYSNNSVSASASDDISSNSATATTIKRRFFGSLPHLRKRRISLFSTPNLHVQISADKDQNSNLSEIVDKTMARQN